MEKYILFGAGTVGRKAGKEFGRENIDFFLDNDQSRENEFFEGVPVKIFSKCVNEVRDREIVITTLACTEIIKQLQQNGILNYSIYSGLTEIKNYYNPQRLIDNPYGKEGLGRDWSEEEWIEMKMNDGETKKEIINGKVSRYMKQSHMFHHIEIETINRCNGVCSFCPINCRIDPREKKVMSEELFKKIIDELAEMDYSGRIALFSNNEPLLDKRILDFHRYARNKLPNARMHLYTNGTLLTMESFTALLEVLDELIIDNYQQDLELIAPCKMIVDYYEQHPEIKEKVTIVLRKPDEILTSRGGDAPNRTQVRVEEGISCVLPFQQMIIRPDGKVSLCCNDPLGKCTLGDASEEKLLDIWYGEKFGKVRECISMGRENFSHCKNCDVFVLD